MVSLAVAVAAVAPALAQHVSFTAGTSSLTFIEGTNTHALPQETLPPSSLYSTPESKITLTGGITGGIDLIPPTPTASNVSSASPAAPTNTQPCNGWVELCPRRYSNITMVGAHNSPFARPGNSASNQALPVKTQLDDGIRFLQAQMQWPANGTQPHLCHTSCDLFDAGPLADWLGEVRDWVDAHPYDVVTVLLENGNYSSPALYAPSIEKSGILKYAYRPEVFPMALEDWPTLEALILHGRRVVLFLDYGADQQAFPWWLDEFSQMWESPFDPLNRSFPCVVQRPPGLGREAAAGRMFLINHNLNAEFDVFGTQLLVPAVALLNETNAAEGFGSLGLAANNCRAEWGRAPNVLNVDYYNYGSPPGSVFEVAAMANNVSYNNTCCGVAASEAPSLRGGGWTVLMSVFVLLVLL